MRVEATLWMHVCTTSRRAINDGVKGSVSVAEFHEMSRAHEWLASSPSSAVTATPPSVGDTGDAQSSAVAAAPTKEMANDVQEVERLTSQLTEEERLLFDLVAVSGWENITTNGGKGFLYPLYRLAPSFKGKLHLEVLLPSPTSAISPDAKPKAKPIAATKTTPPRTRIDVLGLMYHHSRKHYNFNHPNLNDSSCIQQQYAVWWENAKTTAQLIMEHRKLRIDINASKKKDTSSPTSFMSGNAESSTKDATTSTVRSSPSKKRTLEERVQARSDLRESKTTQNKAILSRGQGGSKSEDGVVVVDNKALLELANALRSYSQRRGLTSAGVGGSAIDRLQSRAAGSSSSVVSSAAAVAGGRTKMQTTNIARLSVMDLIKDARIAWNAVVRSGGGGGGKSDSSGYALGSSEGANRGGGGGLAAPVVNIDISRVLFQLRLKMMMAADAKTTLRGTSSALALDVQVSDRRQMELYLLDLLEKLTSLVPNWIHLRTLPSASANSTLLTINGNGGKKPAVTTSLKEGATKSRKINIRTSIIVIRNDTVDYTMDVRAKLGGRITNDHADNTVGSVTANGGEGKKRSLEQGQTQQQRKEQKRHGKTDAIGPSVVADTIVPPSFRRMYGKALGLDETKKDEAKEKK